jgi:hypothetical protein
MFIKYTTFCLTIITTIGVIALFLFPRDPKLKSTEYLMEVYDDGYYIYCDQGFVGVVPLGNTALDSLMIDYNQ